MNAPDKLFQSLRARAAMSGVELLRSEDTTRPTIVAVMPDRSLRRVEHLDDLEAILLRPAASA